MPITDVSTGDLRVYVASLADYNAGRLHGVWVDAIDADEITEAAQAMLKASKEPYAEEWAVHDFEGFGSYPVGEADSFATLAAIGEAIEEHGLAVTAYMAHTGEDVDAALARWDDAYRGAWDSETEYAWEDADSLWDLSTGVGQYFDVDSYRRTLFCNGLFSCDNPDGGVWVFQSL